MHPVETNPQNPLPLVKALYRRRHKVESLFAKREGWRRIAIR